MPGRRNALMPWLIGGFVVILAAIAAGLLSAFLVAILRAVPVPEGALATPTPSPTISVSPSPTSPMVSPSPSASPSAPATPTPEPTPAPTPLVHIVSAGEYLALIADRYGVSVQSIIDLNELRRPDHIEPGQVLLIPVGESGPTPSPTPSS